MRGFRFKIGAFLLLSSFCISCTTNKSEKTGNRKDGMVSYVSFDEIDDNGNFYDEISGEPFYNIGNVKQVDGEIGKAAKFDNASSLELHSFDALTGNNPFTLMCYAKVDTDDVTVVTTNVIAGWGHEKDFGLIKLQCHYGKWCANTSNKNLYTDFDSTANPKFSHIALVYDGTSLDMYVNFSKTGTLKLRGQMDLNATSLYVGGYKNNTKNFSGEIDELFIFNKALTKNEITSYGKKEISFDVSKPTNATPIRTPIENFSAKTAKIVPGMWNEYEYYTDVTTLHFKLYFPKNYSQDKKYPFQLFLHGAMGNGCDVDTIINVHQECTTAKRAITEVEETIVMIPVSIAGQSWVINNSYDEYPLHSYEDVYKLSEGVSLQAVKFVLDDIEENLNIDKNRMYVSGVSAGAMGSWYLMYDNPTRWAGAIICCGRFDPKQAELLKDNHVWIFHGDADTTVDVSCADEMHEALVEAGATNVKYSRLPGYDHSISATWLPKEETLITWLYDQVNTRR